MGVAVNDTNYKFYKKEDIIYLEAELYLLVFDFGLVDFNLVKIEVQPLVESRFWKWTAREITKNTFLKYYKKAKDINEFTPVINNL